MRDRSWRFFYERFAKEGCHNFLSFLNGKHLCTCTFSDFIYQLQKKTQKLIRNRQNLENRIAIFEFFANSEFLKSPSSKPGTYSWENWTGNPERWGILSLSPLPCPAQLMVWGEWKIFEIRPLDFEDVFYFFKWC